LTAAVAVALLCAAATRPTAAQTVAQVIEANPDFSTFVDLAKKTDLEAKLAGMALGPVTVFVPVNAAWGDLQPGLAQNAIKNKQYGMIRSVLLYHIVPGLHPPGSFKDYSSLKTLSGGQPLAVGVSGGFVYLNTFVISKTPVQASNGLVYTIYNVLVPGIIREM
jgi:transforming growth factor-beta-induced protein